MTVCRWCGAATENPKFCSRSCANSSSDRTRPKRQRTSANSRYSCMCCGLPLPRSGRRYCNNACQGRHRREVYIARWLAGDESGSIENGTVSMHVREHLLEQAGHACTRCGWSEVNPRTGTVILTLDHIDGDWRNNAPGNLRVICYNCHTLTPTFNALNKGNPRRQNGRIYNHRHLGD